MYDSRCSVTVFRYLFSQLEPFAVIANCDNDLCTVVKEIFQQIQPAGYAVVQYTI